jgi:hypothetical protein
VVYERGSNAFQEREAELNLVARLSGPNATEGMFLEMQPIMSLHSPHESLNFEVLLRMREADGRVIAGRPADRRRREERARRRDRPLGAVDHPGLDRGQPERLKNTRSSA